MLEQVREAGLALGLVLRSDIVPDRYRHNRRLAIFVHHDAQPVRKRELLVGNVHGLDELP
jgi:hypothetical protein